METSIPGKTNSNLHCIFGEKVKNSFNKFPGNMAVSFIMPISFPGNMALILVIAVNFLL